MIERISGKVHSYFDMEMIDSIQTILKPDASNGFSFLDHHFARLMLRLSRNESKELYLAAALVCKMNREGHICFDLSELENHEFLQENFGDSWRSLTLPSPDQVEKIITAAHVLGAPGDLKPLILDKKKRLYLYRYWEYQEKLSSAIKNRLTSNQPFPDEEAISNIKERLKSYFPADSNQETDWQKIAALVAMLRRFCVITGGPGSGKTYTVARILALLIEFLSSTHELRIALAAPTGKAAVRLQDAVKKAKQDLVCPGEILQSIPEEASTLHRLLGYIPHSPYFRYNAENQLEIDLVVVDEASMIDLALMSKLMQALPAQSRIILLGDSNQLASVEAGAVLGDICNTGHGLEYSQDFIDEIKSIGGEDMSVDSTPREAPAVVHSIATLRRSYRFEKQKGIGALSHAVNIGDGDRALDILKSAEFPEVIWHPLADEDLSNLVLHHVENQSATGDPFEVFERFGRSQILCALREGPQGTRAINATIEKIVRRKFRIGQSGSWFPGQPVLITKNDYSLSLFNGDLGVVLADAEEEDKLKTYFPGPDDKLRSVRPFRLPEHETAYALTVHKSQGSEFQEVHFLMPNRDSPLLSRELIYTAITRATNRVEVWANEPVFLEAVGRRIHRSSGLRDSLWLSGMINPNQ